MTPAVTSRVETRGEDATVDAVDVDVDVANGLERAVVEIPVGSRCVCPLLIREGAGL